MGTLYYISTFATLAAMLAFGCSSKSDNIRSTGQRVKPFSIIENNADLTALGFTPDKSGHVMELETNDTLIAINFRPYSFDYYWVCIRANIGKAQDTLAAMKKLLPTLHNWEQTASGLTAQNKNNQTFAATYASDDSLTYFYFEYRYPVLSGDTAH